MKIRIAVPVLAAASFFALASCGGTAVTENTIELKKNGKIVEYIAEDFEASYYDADELSSFVDSEVDAWTGENDGSIKVSKDKVEDGTAYVTITYDSADTYANFTGTELFSGSVVQAQSAGYDFDLDFISADTETASDDTEDEESDSSVIEGTIISSYISGSEIAGEDDLKVLIIGDAVDVVVPGTVKYISADFASITGKSKVSVDAEDGADVLVYVLYE